MWKKEKRKRKKVNKEKEIGEKREENIPKSLTKNSQIKKNKNKIWERKVERKKEK